MSRQKKTIQVIINPAAGKDEPILNTLNRVFREHGVCWQAAVTHDPGDATRLAKDSVAGGVDVVAGYGGDGTLMEIANGLVGSDIPLGILPGGTGNGFAKELGIPTELEHAAELLCRAPHTRRVDLGLANGQHFLLHAIVGVKSSLQASREMKDRYGILAYAHAILRFLASPQVTHYSVSVDGEEFNRDGLVCMITNAAGLGVDLPVIADINPHNGLLNLFIINDGALPKVGQSLGSNEAGKPIESWQGHKITLQVEPSRKVWLDGDEAFQTPVTFEVVSGALSVLVADERRSAGTE
jgi:diacylglycerol kinase (ATP)